MTDDRLRSRDEARQKRVALERAEAAADARRRRLLTVAGGGLVALALVVALASGHRTGAPTRVAGAATTERMLAGVPQHGIRLGAETAPVHVVEFADLQCPFCRRFAVGELPGLVQDYIRKGTVRIDLRALAFIGPESVRAARVVEAAGRQEKLWNVAELLYENQGPENSGYATDAFLRRVAAAVPGLDVARLMDQRDTAAVTAQLEAAQTLAVRAHVTETPTFLVGRGARLRLVGAAQLPAAVRAAVAG